MRVNEEEFVQTARDFEYRGMKMNDLCIQGLKNYLYYKIPVGSFLYSVLINDLKGAVAKADGYNIHNIPAYVVFINRYFPYGSWGSEEVVDNWMIQ